LRARRRSLKLTARQASQSLDPPTPQAHHASLDGGRAKPRPAPTLAGTSQVRISHGGLPQASTAPTATLPGPERPITTERIFFRSYSQHSSLRSRGAGMPVKVDRAPNAPEFVHRTSQSGRCPRWCRATVWGAAGPAPRQTMYFGFTMRSAGRQYSGQLSARRGSRRFVRGRHLTCGQMSLRPGNPHAR